MKILVKNIALPFTEPESAAGEEALRRLSSALRRRVKSAYDISKISVDARKRENIKLVYTVALSAELTPGELAFLPKPDFEALDEGKLEITERGDKPLAGRPVVIGFGPAGMFCALLLAEYGYAPIVLERGGDVSERASKVSRFYADGTLDENTNIQFGAGGAGTFSDGKLVTRINDPRCRYVLERLAAFGAPRDILIAAKPHSGTDKLRAVVTAVKNEIIRLGGELHFNCRAESVEYTSDGRAISVTIDKNGESAALECGALVLACGHSARDTYHSLAGDGYSLESKPFSVGARIEHLQSDIDAALFGNFAGDRRLSPGEYALSKRTPDGKAVYTFCMCPGGEVAAAASENGGVVTNGMSRYLRDGVNANSALAVAVDPSPRDPLGAIEYQRRLERAAYEAGRDNGEYYAPCQTVGDFIDGRSGTKPGRVKPTYRGGKVALRDLNDILPRDITDMMKLGLNDFSRKLRGFAASDAILTGVETRTSAPIRILRGDAMTAPGRPNVYPCGEGAGYAGGITSAAVDGIKTAEAIIKTYKPM